MTIVPKHKIRLKRLIIIVPIFIAIVLVGVMTRFRKGPEKLPVIEVSHKVRVIQAQEIDVVPRTVGYGYVEPGQVWQVVPEVSGKVIEVSPAFRKGNFANTGDVLVKIDPKDFQLIVKQMVADIENVRAQISELERKEKNYASSLEIEKSLLELKKKEVDRNYAAKRSHAVSESAFDQAQTDYQSQLVRVQDLENSLSLIPTSRKVLEANLEVNQAKLDEARINLQRTEIIVPFHCRITKTSAEIGQYVQQGQSIAEADGTGRAEITAQVPMETMPRLFAGVDRSLITAGVETIDRIKMDKIKKLFNLKVKVRLVNENFKTGWDAYFARADATIDAQTRTVGIIVVVDNPYDQIILGVRPPLVRNMFCEVEISGRPISKRIVIPRIALHTNHAYVVNSENRLQRRKVTVDFAQADFYVLKDGLVPGERVVVSDLISAIDGMLLELVEDEELSKRLYAQADGRTEIE